MSPRTLFLGNWKMNMRPREVAEFASRFMNLYSPAADQLPDTGFAAPFTSLAALEQSFGRDSGILRGAQNVHWLASGAHTGEISAPMLNDHGVHFVVVGHSERRQFYGESSEDVAMRAQTAIRHGMMAVVCIGETQSEFQAGATKEVVHKQLLESLHGITAEQLPHLVVAYEPVWAIGTGLAATPEIAEEVHDFLRQELMHHFGAEGSAVPILYGGSTKPENIEELLALENVNGALVGGSSLIPETFWELVRLGRAADRS